MIAAARTDLAPPFRNTSDEQIFMSALTSMADSTPA
jgi:hypothetical protein